MSTNIENHAYEGKNFRLFTGDFALTLELSSQCQRFVIMLIFGCADRDRVDETEEARRYLVSSSSMSMSISSSEPELDARV